MCPYWKACTDKNRECNIFAYCAVPVHRDAAPCTAIQLREYEIFLILQIVRAQGFAKNILLKLV